MMVNGSLINLFYNVLECLGLGLDEQDKLLEPILKLSNFGDNPDHTEVSPNLKIKTGVWGIWLILITKRYQNIPKQKY